MSRHLFVWRMAPGPRAGAPCEPSPGQREAAHRPRESGHPAQGPLDATGTLDDVFDELSHGRLRCGWGWHTLRSMGGWTRRAEVSTIGWPVSTMGPRILSFRTPWGGRPVWCRLREMSAGDGILLPKSPADGHFMVATVQRPYACDRATVVVEADVG
jgi:hypothetical protein